MAGKQAVVFVLDTNPTMNASYPPPGDDRDYSVGTVASTRLSQAKDAVLGSAIDLMWRSKTNEVGTVVLKAGATHHHLAETERIAGDDGVGEFFRSCAGGVRLDRYDDGGGDVFPNLVELELNRPTLSTLRAMKDIQCTTNDCISSTIQGDFCDGLILAADMLHRRTKNKKYERKIVMITDAEHEVEVNGEQLQCVLRGLTEMEVELIVVGIGFEGDHCASFKDEASCDSRDSNLVGDGNSEVNDRDTKLSPVVSWPGEDDVAIKEEGNPDDDVIVGAKQESRVDMWQLIKRENEKLLSSIVRGTHPRGCILKADGINLADLLHTKLPCLAGTTKSVGKNSEFRIAPNLTVFAKSAKLTDKKNLPSAKKEAFEYNPKTGEKLRDSSGELMTSPVKSITYHYDEEGNEVPFDKRTDAFRYGLDLLPIGKLDIQGINKTFGGPPGVEILGYIDRCTVQSSNMLMGPAYAYTGGNVCGDSKKGVSTKARAAVAALSQALEECGKVGLCRITRMADGEPRIGAIIPKVAACEDETSGPDAQEGRGRYLVILDLPFQDDLQEHSFPPVPFDFRGDLNDEEACDNLIDSMMLPDDEFRSEQISSPSLKSHQTMIAQFAMNPLTSEEETDTDGLSEGRISEISMAKPLCEFDAPKAISIKASRQIDDFMKTFPLVEHQPRDEKKQAYWGSGISN